MMILRKKSPLNCFEAEVNGTWTAFKHGKDVASNKLIYYTHSLYSSYTELGCRRRFLSKKGEDEKGECVRERGEGAACPLERTMLQIPGCDVYTAFYALCIHRPFCGRHRI